MTLIQEFNAMGGRYPTLRLMSNRDVLNQLVVAMTTNYAPTADG